MQVRVYIEEKSLGGKRWSKVAIGASSGSIKDTAKAVYADHERPIDAKVPE